VEHYANSGIQAHLIIPVLTHGNVAGLLSLQWQHPCTLREDELVTLHLAAQQIALALCCAGC
jgi:GAF domain-containing protein